jgi:sugar phosphate permease
VPLQKEFGWSTAEISSALSIRFILFGLMAPFAAALMNRYGLRNVALSAQLIVVSGLVASLAMTKVWQLMLLWGVVIGIGTGMTALVLGATIAARWFVAQRGLVVGIMTASVATGQLVFLPLLASLTERFGWRVALSLVCVMLGVSAFLVLLMMRDRPSDVGLRPFGDEGKEPLPAPPPNTAPIMAAALGTLRDVSGSPVFWILFFTFFICGASTNGLVQVHLIPMCLDFGIPQVQAAGLLAAMGIFDFFGTIMSGWLSDRYDNRWLLFWYYGLRGCRWCFCHSPISRSTACRCLRCSTAWTGSPPCRRRCASPRNALGRNAPIWCSAGSLPATSSAPALLHWAPACRGRCCRAICPPSSWPVRSASSRR